MGLTIATDIFWSWINAIDPIGKDIKMENIIVTVIWVLEDNMTANSSIFIPLSTAQTRVLWNRNYSSISISAIDTNIVEQTKTELETALKWYLWIKEIQKITSAQERTFKIKDKNGFRRIDFGSGFLL